MTTIQLKTADNNAPQDLGTALQTLLGREVPQDASRHLGGQDAMCVLPSCNSRYIVEPLQQVIIEQSFRRVLVSWTTVVVPFAVQLPYCAMLSRCI